MEAQTNDPKAYELFLRSLQLTNLFTAPELREAQRLLGDALLLDPSYEEAAVQLGWVHGALAVFGYSLDPANEMERARDLAEQVLERNDRSASALSLQGTLMHEMTGDFDRAIPLAIELEPGNYFPRGVIGVTLTQVGRTDEAISHTRASMRLSPYYPDWLLYTLAQAFIVSGNYEEALPATVTLVDRTKATWTGPLLWLAVIHYDEGRFDESKEAVTRAVEADPNLTSVTDIGNHNFTDPSIMRRWRAIWVEMGMPEE